MRAASPAEAAKLLREGLVALVPTETVVGLVASETGLKRLAEIKDRDPDKPIAMLCGSPEEAFALAASVPPIARKLAKHLWPGPLTLVLDAADGGGTVGLRVPDHATIQALLVAHGEPLYATSANIAGEPAPRSLDDADPRVTKAVDLAVGGEAGKGEASAVVDLSGGQVRLVRPTVRLSKEELSRLAEGVGDLRA